MKHNLKAYREAKIMLPHIQTIATTINESITKLEKYKSYLPVIKVIKVLNEQKSILEAHEKKCLDILKSRGRF